MLRKLLIIFFLIIINTNVLADRYYVGPVLGFISTKVKYESGLSNTILSINNSSYTNNFLGGAVFGYTHCFGNGFAGAIELKVFSRTKEAQNTIQTITTDVIPNVTRNAIVNQKQKSSYGISLKPGIFVTDNIWLYGDVGFLLANYKGNATIVYNDGTPTLNQSFNQRVNGMTLGAGLEANINTRWGVRAEYLHVFYNNYLIKDFPDAGFNPQFRPQTDQVTMGLIFTFGDNFIV